jgi:hypothetical protein
MATSDNVIIVDDPDAPDSAAPSVVSARSVNIAVYLVLLALSVLLAYDNWQTGMGWAPEGPEAGYFPFYLSVMMGAASIYGLGIALWQTAGADESFVSRDQLRRVMQVFVPTLLFCLLTQWLGMYVASFLLVAGFMRFVGHIALWKSLLTAAIFSIAMFITFDVAFDVIMPKGPLEAFFGY